MSGVGTHVVRLAIDLQLNHGRGSLPLARCSLRLSRVVWRPGLDRMYATKDSNWPSVSVLEKPGMTAPAVPSGGCSPSSTTLIRLVALSPVTAVLSVSFTPPNGRGRTPSWQFAHAAAYMAAPVSLLGISEADGFPLGCSRFPIVDCNIGGNCLHIRIGNCREILGDRRHGAMGIAMPVVPPLAQEHVQVFGIPRLE